MKIRTKHFKNMHQNIELKICKIILVYFDFKIGFFNGGGG